MYDQPFTQPTVLDKRIPYIHYDIDDGMRSAPGRVDSEFMEGQEGSLWCRLTYPESEDLSHFMPVYELKPSDNKEWLTDFLNENRIGYEIYLRDGGKWTPEKFGVKLAPLPATMSQQDEINDLRAKLDELMAEKEARSKKQS